MEYTPPAPAILPGSSAPSVPLGSVRDAARTESGLTITAANGVLSIAVLADDLLRIGALRHGQEEPDFSYAVVKADWPAPDFQVEDGDGAVTLKAGRATLTVAKEDGRLTVTMRGTDVPVFRDARIEWKGEGVRLAWSPSPSRRYYGCGEKAGPLERRGEPMQFWNAERPGYGPGQDPLYQSIPFTLGMDGQHAHGFYVDNTFRQTWDLGAPASGETASVTLDGGALDLYIFTSGAPKAVLSRWTDLVGRIPMPPLWALGYQQSRWSYFPESTVRNLAAEFRTRQVPCDVIWFDIDYMQDYKDFTWDHSRFPDPKRLIADLKADGFQSIVILDPGVKVEDGYSVYEELKRGGFYVRKPDGAPFVGPVWPGDCFFPDFTDPRCRAWWGDQYRGLIQQGVSGFWNDMNEPAVFNAPGHTMPADVRMDGDGHPGTHARYHNVYGMNMARATYEGARRLRPEERAFVLTRAGFAGGHRYAATWTGDNSADWPGLWLSVPMLMNLGLSGQAISGPDIGGFMGDPSPELFTRWLQVGALFPFCRCHHAASKHEGAFDRTQAAAQEPWSHGGEYERINRESIELRYRLLPYLYTLAEEAARTGVPLMRPLFLEYPDDPHCYGISDQFMLGEDLLCAPILREGATSCAVYLPEGEWFDFWTNEHIPGGQTISTDAPLDVLPLYVRGGAAIPMQPVVQHTGESQSRPIIWRVYLDRDGAKGDLYEDDGHSMDYERGAFSRTALTAAPDGTVRFATEGSYRSPRPPAQVEIISAAG